MGDIKLIGHSGCKLEISDKDGLLSVVKTSKSDEYNIRLQKQCEKQKVFKHDFFKTPLILDDKYDDSGLFSFSMEYINGLTLSEYLRKIGITDIEKMAQMFFCIIPEKCEFDNDAKGVFIPKIEELENKISSTEKDEGIGEIFSKLKAYDWSCCVRGDCHGDMTLENIIWSNDSLYLIDFLDSFYDSWMIDFAKLLQDLECKWSYRNDGGIDENLEIRLLIFKQVLLDRLSLIDADGKLLNTIYCMLLINLLRIMPYTSDSRIKIYLRREIDKIFKKINFD